MKVMLELITRNMETFPGVKAVGPIPNTKLPG